MKIKLTLQIISFHLRVAVKLERSRGEKSKNIQLQNEYQILTELSQQGELGGREEVVQWEKGILSCFMMNLF